MSKIKKEADIKTNRFCNLIVLAFHNVFQCNKKKQKHVVFKPIVIASPSGSLSMGHASHRLWDAIWKRGPVIAEKLRAHRLSAPTGSTGSKYNTAISKIVGSFDRFLKILTNFVFSFRCLNRLRLYNNNFYRLVRNDNIRYSKKYNPTQRINM